MLQIFNLWATFQGVMDVFVLHHDKIKVYSSKEKVLNAYMKLLKSYYTHFDREVRTTVRELADEFYNFIPEDHKRDLINFIQERPFQGIFTLEELNSIDMAIQVYAIKMDE